jgi:hypothetical protein
MISRPNNEQAFLDEIVDLEEFAKSNKTPPSQCKGYRIRVDKQFYTVTQSVMTGRQILELAGKTPVDRYSLRQKFSGGQTKKITLNDKVDFTTPGIERFMTLPLDQTEGYSERRQFHLPETDEKYLTTLGLSWETVIESNIQRLVVHGFPVPTGYNCNEVDLNLQIPQAYPDAQLDMVYFHPHLSRLNSKPIVATQALDSFDGKQWQRWSRHRTGTNPWRPGLDCIETHLGLVENWLERELVKV